MNKENFAEVVRQYHAKVFRLCFGMLGAQDQADDAAQDIFVKAYERLDSFREQTRFSTWLFRLASNHCLDLLRARRHRKTEPLEVAIDHISERDQAPIQDLAQHLLSQLTVDHRLILTLREYKGLNYQEIAEVMDLSLDGVKSLLKRARQDLLKKFDTFQATQTSK
ncbi:MAG: ECF RNA polymerase sigma factor SigW [Elusimicrobia bacterium]|nr:ECF RNA polymerase sigma factor SigW [Elusimicrobiota bacterium]